MILGFIVCGVHNFQNGLSPNKGTTSTVFLQCVFVGVLERNVLENYSLELNYEMTKEKLFLGGRDGNCVQKNVDYATLQYCEQQSEAMYVISFVKVL